MGSNTSVPAASASTTHEKKYTAQAQRSPESAAELLAALSLRSSSPASASGHVTTDLIDTWHHAFASSPKNRLASTVLSKTNWTEAIINNSRPIADQQIFNTKLSLEGNPVTNQKSSGRCWLFAFTNNVRIEMMKKYDLEEFQLSQSYLFFVDSLSKANYFLEQMLDLADTPLDDRLVQVLLSEPENDGGQWDMIVGLVNTFGLVPQAVYPESFNSSATGKLDTLLTSKLREYAIELRSLFDGAMKSLDELSGKSYAEKKSLAIQSARKRKEDQMSEMYRILAITLGAPPKPDESFVWEYYSKDKKYHRVETTPVSFYKDYCLIDASRNISLIDDPRNEYDALYTVDRLGSVVGQRPVTYVNAGAEKLKETAIKLLKADHAVWFGCDVGKSSSNAAGLMDADLWNLEDAFGTTLGLDKAARLRTGDSAMTHAMLITAVHLENGKPVRWRVENSWGPDACTKGYMCMTDEWFTEHVFQVVAPRNFIDKKLVDLFDHGKPAVLPRWDPMGALA
ncbi:C1 family peptidase [Sporobolomyces koalae]|uniref:C1 family peptidase n=1 Tax=Sporobolomyces koalae TaxID=500713 RepID=UPI0031819A02